MRVLGIDTSSDRGAVAVVVDGAALSERSVESRSRHGEVLLSLVDGALSEARVERGSLDLIAVGLGPGSFTGTRIGVVTAKGLAFALGAPIVGVGSLHAVAASAGDSEAARIAVATNAYRGEVFLAVYERVGSDPRSLREQLAPCHLTPEAAARAIADAGCDAVMGDGPSAHEALAEGLRAASIPWLAPERAYPRASVIATLGQAKLGRDGPDPLDALEPRYVRASDAVLPADP